MSVQDEVTWLRFMVQIHREQMAIDQAAENKRAP